jgi:hypothetical protein
MKKGMVNHFMMPTIQTPEECSQSKNLLTPNSPSPIHSLIPSSLPLRSFSPPSLPFPRQRTFLGLPLRVNFGGSLSAGEGFPVREKGEYISRCISCVGGTRTEGWWEGEEEGEIRVQRWVRLWLLMGNDYVRKRQRVIRLGEVRKV